MAAIENDPAVRYDSFAEHYSALKLVVVVQDSVDINNNNDNKRVEEIIKDQ